MAVFGLNNYYGSVWFKKILWQCLVIFIIIMAVFGLNKFMAVFGLNNYYGSLV